MNKTFFIYVGLALSILFLIGSSNAQDNAADEVSFDYIFGKVQSLTGTSVILESYNVEKDEYNEIEIAVDEETEYEEFDSLADITTEDYVEIFYEIYPERLLAKKIVKDMSMEDSNDFEENIEEEVNSYDEEELPVEDVIDDEVKSNYMDQE